MKFRNILLTTFASIGICYWDYVMQRWFLMRKCTLVMVRKYQM